MARENPGEITLCPVGPITNVAIALARAPEIAGLLKEIVVMGSTIFHPGIQGIPTPMADANFWNDPEAAQIVLRSGARITLVGMDVTMKVLLTAEMSDTIARAGGRVGADADGDRAVLRELLRGDVSRYRRLRDARSAGRCDRGGPLAGQDGAHVRRYRACRDADAVEWQSPTAGGLQSPGKMRTSASRSMQFVSASASQLRSWLLVEGRALVERTTRDNG